MKKGSILKLVPVTVIAVTGLVYLACSIDKGPVFLNTDSLDVRSEKLRAEKLGPACEVLKPLHLKRGPVLPGDWLKEHEEKGQSFTGYKKSNPNRPDDKKKFIYIQLIGKFTEAQGKVLDQTILYMEESFGLKVKKLPEFPLEKIPENARRHHPVWKNHQLYTRYIMDKVLLPERPDDAVALIGFTGVDLYPDPDWNFVFGIASLRNRVGLWSIYRNGDPSVNEKTFKSCLERTIGTAIHETGHIFGIHHCIAYECVMAGCNSQEEADRRNLYYCPSCLQKLTWNTRVKPADRFKRMAALMEKLKFPEEKKFFEESLELLKKKDLLDSN